MLPADQKWYTRYLVSEILASTLEKINPRYPVVDKDKVKNLQECKALLENEP